MRSKSEFITSTWNGIYEKLFFHKFTIFSWLQHFPPDQIHIVDGERLITSPAVEVNQVEKFLGLKSGRIWNYSDSQSLMKFTVVKPEDFAIDPHKHFPCVRAKGELHCLGATKGRKHPKVSKSIGMTFHSWLSEGTILGVTLWIYEQSDFQVQIGVLQKLADFFEPHNLEFFKMINRKFYWSPERNVSLIH